MAINSHLLILHPFFLLKSFIGCLMALIGQLVSLTLKSLIVLGWRGKTVKKMTAALSGCAFYSGETIHSLSCLLWLLAMLSMGAIFGDSTLKLLIEPPCIWIACPMTAKKRIDFVLQNRTLIDRSKTISLKE